MAVLSGIHRTIIIPFGGKESGNFDETGLLPKLATLVADPANTLVPSANVSYQMFETFSGGSWHFGRGIKIELWMTIAGDPVVLGNLPAFQTALGVAVYSWSDVINFGF